MKNTKEKIVLLGSTGSIGTQTLQVLSITKDCEVLALACNKNISLLKKQIKQFKPKYVCVYDEKEAKKLEEYIHKNKLNITLYIGMNGLKKLCTIKEASLVIIALVGVIGIEPTIEAIKNKKNIALANKETLVCAGSIIMPLVKKYKIELRPIDSEHSAIWQSLNGEKESTIKKILLTASGGPFYNKNINDLKKVTLHDCLNHPTWKMGNKITIDCSTMVNKGFEVIEAMHLFNVEAKNIQVIIQRESIIHSAVLFKDGAIKAELSVPSMKIPIEYAIYKNNRRYIKERELDFNTLKNLSFDKPDLNTFKGLKIAYEVAKKKGLYPTSFNILNDEAVNLFLNKKIEYLDIYKIIQSGLKDFENKKLNKKNPKLKDILDLIKYEKEYICNLYQ
ncbi:MAG: 1-deoxy-D-xylulose-5-phosphate reductoisomerase [Eubacteriales bacterium]|nr:1-deoxy-D-xylulose-5-phosphate reductoisomerase [Eubacteriales bacterium]